MHSCACKIQHYKRRYKILVYLEISKRKKISFCWPFILNSRLIQIIYFLDCYTFYAFEFAPVGKIENNISSSSGGSSPGHYLSFGCGMGSLYGTCDVLKGGKCRGALSNFSSALQTAHIKTSILCHILLGGCRADINFFNYIYCYFKHQVNNFNFSPKNNREETICNTLCLPNSEQKGLAQDVSYASETPISRRCWNLTIWIVQQTMESVIQKFKSA